METIAGRVTGFSSSLKEISDSLSRSKEQLLNTDVEKELKEYFQNCKYVARAPGVIFVEGNKHTRKAKVLPVPLYAYAGLEKRNIKEVLYEERDLSISEKEREKDIIQFSGTKNFSLYSIERRNRLYYFNAYRHLLINPFRNNNKDDYMDCLKIKVWSDIPPNMGLNESSAIASAITLSLFAYLEESTNEPLLQFEKVKTNKIMPKVIENDFYFTLFFLIALKFDFFCNGAGILGSLSGLSKKRDVIDYECLVYDKLKDSLKVDPKTELDTLPKPHILYNYDQACEDLIDNFEMDGLPLFKCSYIDLPSLLKLENPIEMSIISQNRPLNDITINLEVNKANIKCFEIYPYSVVLIGSLKNIRFYERGEGKDFIFKTMHPVRRGFERFFCNSWGEEWEVEGAKLLKPEEYKLQSTPKEKVSVIGEKTGGEKAEINFWEKKVKIGDSKPDSKYQQPYELLEYFMNKRDDVHWVEGIWIFFDWRNIREDIHKLKSIFGVIISKLKGPNGIFSKNKLNLSILELEGGFYRLEGLDSCYSNIMNAEIFYKTALLDYRNSLFDEAKNKILEAIKNYRDHISSWILLIKLMPMVEIEKSYKDEEMRILQRRINILKESIKTAEHYIAQLENKDWRNKWEKEEEREFGVEIEIFHTNLVLELKELEEAFENLRKLLLGEGISFKSDKEYGEIKDLIEKQDFDRLIKKDAIRFVLSRIEWFLEEKIYSHLKRDIYKNVKASLRKTVLEKLDADKKKEAVEKLREVVLGLGKKSLIDFSKAASLSSLCRYLFRTVEGNIKISLRESELAPKEDRHLREFTDLKKKMGKELEDRGIYREVTDEECFEKLKETKDVGSEYFEYIKALRDKRKKVLSLMVAERIKKENIHRVKRDQTAFIDDLDDADNSI